MAGKVPKGDKDTEGFINWRTKWSEVLLKVFEDAQIIDPYDPDLDEGDFLQVVGQDFGYIKRASLIVVNAEEKIGAGTAMEMVTAKYFKKPVITVIPKDTHHRRSNVVFHGKLVDDWIHPFIWHFSDIVVESVDEIEDIKKKLESTEIKGISIIDEAIEYASSLK
ncbi:MAG: hypothetical protein UX78_C0009G0035 [Candidatus Amesbacteria bacterium GW2011_GWA2_47_11]|uniref:Nucleoside 2-deoxyribosyltransferase n=2 Tax=Candidatus Amesiibacteriota TaxID=1752730 RepID=A0A0G1TQH8_9BACT|nr:MAG: hypothetical protein UX78_C0009G0035 [Candidatus Amesbacteria bacterium GW2011_GWA2_47_11]